jgi:hypothetical protein
MLYIIAGFVVLDGSNTYAIPLLLVGTAANVTGWLILPGTGGRRLAVFFPALVTQWLLLTGPQSVWFMALPFLGWLFLRERPLRSYVTVLIVVAAGILFAKAFTDAHYEAMSYGLEAAVVIGSAWLARALATTKRRRRATIREQ